MHSNHVNSSEPYLNGHGNGHALNGSAHSVRNPTKTYFPIGSKWQRFRKAQKVTSRRRPNLI